jgi:hypothetical protein
VYKQILIHAKLKPEEWEKKKPRAAWEKPITEAKVNFPFCVKIICIY